MQTIETTIYKYAELPTEAAKEKAREWYREFVFQDSNDWEHVQSDAVECARILGIDIDTRSETLRSGKTRENPCLWFSLAYCQGDGASFDGSYSYAKESRQAIRKYAPQDEKLHAMADLLYEIQRPHFFKLVARIRSSNYYGLSVDAEHAENMYRDIGDSEKELRDIFNDFCNWYYEQVRAEYEYQSSDEAVIEAIVANEYDFYEDGSRTRHI